MKPRHVLIVGGGSAIGAAVAERLARQSITVTSLSRGQATPSSAVRQGITIDYSAADWPEILSKVDAPPIDAVLFAPGYAAFGPALTIPEAEARQMLEVNFWLLHSVSRAIAGYWKEKQMPGDFWAVLSLAALRAIPGEAYYCAAKAAAARLLDCLDLENRPAGQRFRYFCPGKFDSPFRAASQRDGAASAPGDNGSPLSFVADKIATAMISRRPAKVIGWKENAIAIADRLFPELYDRLILDRRISSQP